MPEFLQKCLTNWNSIFNLGPYSNEQFEIEVNRNKSICHVKGSLEVASCLTEMSGEMNSKISGNGYQMKKGDIFSLKYLH